MLNDADRELIVQVVARHLRFTNEYRVDLFNLCPTCGYELLLEGAASPLGWAEQFIRLLIDDGWRNEPPWIVAVLTRLTFFYNELNPVLERVTAARANGAAPTDPLNDLWLDSSGTPFIDRATLRDLVRKVADPVNGPSVLLINGNPKSGKSYTVELLRHWQQRRQASGSAAAGVAAPPSNSLAPSLAFVPLFRGMGASLTPEVLARKIVDAMQRRDAPLPPSNATPNRTGHYLVDWIVEQAEASGKEWWVVIDPLDDDDLLEQTRNMVSILAQCITGPVARKAIRLILIDYPPGSLHGVLMDEHAREQIGTIGEIDAKLFFRQVLSKDGSVPEHILDAFFTFAMKDVPPGDLCKLNQTLSQVALSQGSAGGQ